MEGNNGRHCKTRFYFSLYEWTEIDALTYRWLLVLSAVVLTTIHISDLPNINEDQRLGRRTLPSVISVSEVAQTTGCIIIGWSVVLAFKNYNGSPYFALGILMMGVAICKILLRAQGRYFPREIDLAYKLYTIWLILIAFSPAME